MGSFLWDNDMCYSQYHNGRPLSVALIEPFEPECTPYIENNFASNQHHRSRSSGRNYKRESYSIHYPNTRFHSFCFSPYRPINHDSSRDLLIEKLETVTIEEQQFRSPPCMTRYVCTPSPPIRQVKIRSRPSSCVDLHNNRRTKYVDEHHEEHYQYHYNYNLPSDHSVPIQREASPPRIRRHDITTATDDLYVPVKSKPVRPATRDAGTTTADLSRRPLSRSETQVIERYETDEKIHGDSISLTDPNSGKTIIKRPLQRGYDDDDFVDKQQQKASKKMHRKDFVQRMHARNGTSLKSYNSLNIYSDYGKGQVIVRPTAKPREALVDTYGIIASPGELSEPTTPITTDYNSRSRSYFQRPDFI